MPKFTLIIPPLMMLQNSPGMPTSQNYSRPKPDWIYFGTLFQMSPQARQLTYRLIDSHIAAHGFFTT